MNIDTAMNDQGRSPRDHTRHTRHTVRDTTNPQVRALQADFAGALIAVQTGDHILHAGTPLDDDTRAAVNAVKNAAAGH